MRRALTAEASIRGRAVSLGEAVKQAASILVQSRSPVIAGMLTDAAGTEAALALAASVGAVIDHAHAAAAIRDLDVMREAGWIVTTPLQVRARADLVLLVGPGLDTAWPGYEAKLRLHEPPPLAPDKARQIVRLCPGGEGFDCAATTIGGDVRDLPILVGALRALCAEHAVREQTPRLDELRACAEALNDARYGAVLWSARELSGLGIEMLCGLIDDLNRRSRFAGLPLAPPGNAAGVMQACAWTCGFPFRTSFARGRAEHDPWRFDAARMVADGEADAALWIAASEPLAPAWDGSVPIIGIAAQGVDYRAIPEVEIVIGRPGVDHAAVLFDADCGALVAKAGTAGAMLSAAQVLRQIADALGTG
jgi:formylmethanofuran dehydrogenase subunit B